MGRGFVSKSGIFNVKNQCAQRHNTDSSLLSFSDQNCKELKMPSLKKTSDILLLSHDLGSINVEEFLLLYKVNHSDNLIFNHKDYKKFRLDAVDEEKCKALFRVLKPDFPLLLNALQIPDVFITSAF